jgi:hypothetical protein
MTVDGTSKLRIRDVDGTAKEASMRSIVAFTATLIYATAAYSQGMEFALVGCSIVRSVIIVSDEPTMPVECSARSVSCDGLEATEAAAKLEVTRVLGQKLRAERDHREIDGQKFMTVTLGGAACSSAAAPGAAQFVCAQIGRVCLSSTVKR